MRRAVESVLRDVRGGLMSPEAARRHYGGAVTGDRRVDEAATAELRRSVQADDSRSAPVDGVGTGGGHDSADPGG